MKRNSIVQLITFQWNETPNIIKNELTVNEAKSLTYFDTDVFLKWKLSAGDKNRFSEPSSTNLIYFCYNITKESNYLFSLSKHTLCLTTSFFVERLANAVPFVFVAIETKWDDNWTVFGIKRHIRVNYVIHIDFFEEIKAWSFRQSTFQVVPVNASNMQRSISF